MSGFFKPAAAKMSMTPSDATARDMIWRMARSSLVRAATGRRATPLVSTGRPPGRTPRRRGSPSPPRAARPGRTPSISSVTAVRQALLAVLLREDVLLGGRQECTAAAGLPDLATADQSNPWKMPQQISYFSSMTATASAWSMAVLPFPPLSV